MIVWLTGAAGGVGRLAAAGAAAGGTGEQPLIAAELAAISVQDRGLTVGDGAFETIKVLPGGQPFALTRHLDRLRASAAVLDIETPADGELREAVAAVVAANAGALAGGPGRLRITLTQGLGVLGDPYAGPGEPTLLVTVVPQPSWGATSRVALSPYRRNPKSALAGVKSTSYAENAIALRAAKARGADEALLLATDGQVCEGTGSNIFAVVDGQLLTPPLSSGCLNGITRQLVIEWCGAVEAPLAPAELARADEVFITSSTRDVHPVSWLDLTPTGPGGGALGARELAAPGPITAAAVATWREREAADADP